MQCFLGSKMIIRIYMTENLAIGKIVPLSEKQCNYLANVLRLKINDTFFVFDGKNGEFEAKICQLNHKKGAIEVVQKVKNFYQSPDVWLLFAPLKKDCTDMVIQKATELGVRKIYPIITEYTNSEKVRIDRFVAQSIEASEQSRRLDIPQIEETLSLEKILQNWPEDRKLFFLNEKGEGQNICEVMQKNAGKSAILVGPEGGFSEKECEKLLSYDFVCPIFLGKRILRAETAVISALSCWQAINGDW